MRETRRIRDAAVSSLRAAGLDAFAAYPARQAGRNGPTAAVSVETVQSREAGFTGYLGEVREGGAVREVYGRRLEGVISADIRAERAAECETGCEKAEEALLEGLPSGIRPGGLTWEALRWERETGMFLRRCRLAYTAFFVASCQEGQEEFLDFQLKGVLKE